MSDAPYGERRNPSPRFLPPDPGVSAPYRLTPGLAVRVGVLGIVAIVVFALVRRVGGTTERSDRAREVELLV